MIAIEQVPLQVTLPSSHVRMVLMQPHVQLQNSLTGPLRWDPAKVQDQLAGIRRTLDIAGSALGAKEQAHFTVFPEYAIPGLDGVRLIDAAVRDGGWPPNTVIIGGVDGLDKDQYVQLCDGPDTSVHDNNKPDKLAPHHWVNCCVTWAKEGDGQVRRWVQAKIRPAWDEVTAQCHDMFCGSSAFVFKATFDQQDFPCHFLTFLCFDWVAAPAGKTVWREVVEDLQQKWEQQPGLIQWVFVPQRNPKPNHHSFIDSTYDCLTDVLNPAVDRREAGVVHANVALWNDPDGSRYGGYTSVVYGPLASFDCNACRPTVCTRPSRLRKIDKLARLRDSVFREMGPCIHSFRTRVPKFIQAGATDRCPPVEDAHVYSLDGSVNGRTPGGPVAACVKWMHDQLDELRPLSDTDLSDCPLADNARAAHDALLPGLRSFSAERCHQTMDLASPSIRLAGDTDMTAKGEPTLKWADNWGGDEKDALMHLTDSVTAIGIVSTVDPVGGSLHATARTENRELQVAVVCGKSHDQCVNHFRKVCTPVLHDPVILITRDASNLVPRPEEQQRFTQPGEQCNLRIVDYQTLIQRCRTAQTPGDLAGELDEYFSPPDASIV